MVNPFAGKDRRKAPRIKGTVVEYSLSDQKTFDRTAFMKDISLTGIGVCLDQQVSIDSQVYFKIYFPGKQAPINVAGQVRWQKKAGFLNYYETGVQFDVLDDETVQGINEYIDKSLEGTE